jgi:hypothetical protein
MLIGVANIGEVDANQQLGVLPCEVRDDRLAAGETAYTPAPRSSAWRIRIGLIIDCDRVGNPVPGMDGTIVKRGAWVAAIAAGSVSRSMTW